jgi:hypothetical protein
MAAGAGYTAAQGTLWGIAASIGLVSVPVWVPIGGALAGLTIVGGAAKLALDRVNYRTEVDAIRVGFQICTIIASKYPQCDFSPQLISLLGQYTLTEQDLNRIRSGMVSDFMDVIIPQGLDDRHRQAILRGVFSICYRADKGKKSRALFKQAAARLGLESIAADRWESLYKQAGNHENLIDGMFASCGAAFQTLNIKSGQPFLDTVASMHYNRQFLDRALKVGDLGAMAAQIATTYYGGPAAGKIVQQVWNGVRASTSAIAGQRLDEKREAVSNFARQIGMSGPEFAESYRIIDSTYDPLGKKIAR